MPVIVFISAAIVFGALYLAALQFGFLMGKRKYRKKYDKLSDKYWLQNMMISQYDNELQIRRFPFRNTEWKFSIQPDKVTVHEEAFKVLFGVDSMPGMKWDVKRYQKKEENDD